MRAIVRIVKKHGPAGVTVFGLELIEHWLNVTQFVGSCAEWIMKR